MLTVATTLRDIKILTQIKYQIHILPTANAAIFFLYITLDLKTIFKLLPPYNFYIQLFALPLYYTARLLESL